MFWTCRENRDFSISYWWVRCKKKILFGTIFFALWPIVCYNAIMTYYQEHKQIMIDNARKWHFANPLKRAKAMRTLHYRNKYKGTIADYDFHFSIQDGKCAICGRTDNYHNEHFDMDHDHFTGELRGLLCTACNRLVGLAERLCLTNVRLLDKVEKYLNGRVELFAFC